MIFVLLWLFGWSLTVSHHWQSFGEIFSLTPKTSSPKREILSVFSVMLMIYLLLWPVLLFGRISFKLDPPAKSDEEK